MWGPEASRRGPVFQESPLASECAITPTSTPESQASVIRNLSGVVVLLGAALGIWGPCEVVAPLGTRVGSLGVELPGTLSVLGGVW